MKKGFVETEGHRLAYQVANAQLIDQTEDPIIVFIHGVLSSYNIWHDCIPESFRNKPWFSLSLPGHNPSEIPKGFKAEDVNEDWFFRLMSGALEKLLGDRKIIVVGHSTGGFCGLILALGKAPNVKGIISIGGFYKGNWNGSEGMMLKISGIGNWTKPIFVNNLRVFQKSMFIQRIFTSQIAHDSKAFLANPLSEKYLKNVFPNVSKQNYNNIFPVFRGISKICFLDRLKEIDIPCYIFSGSEDPVISAKQTLVLAGKIPNAKLVVFEGVGHMPFIEDAENYFTQFENAVEEISSS